MKIKAKDLSKEQKAETLQALFSAAATLKDRNAVRVFLNTLLTESERIMLGRRVQIARKLLNGETSRSISADLKVGLDTVFKMEKWLDAEFPGYEKMLAQVPGASDKEEKKKLRQDLWAQMKKKYPLHFLLFP